MHKHKKGFLAEIFILFFYVCRFYIPLKHRYKTKLGEVDLIMKRGNTVIFIEVKARSCGMHENIVSKVQQLRISKAASLFIASRVEYHNHNMRFDLAVVKPYKLPEIIENAW